MSNFSFQLDKGTSIRIVKCDKEHPICNFLINGLPELNINTLKYVALFYISQGFFSTKRIFLSFCFSNIAERDLSAEKINKLLDVYFEKYNDEGINIIFLSEDVDSEKDLIDIITKTVNPFYS